LSEQKAQQAKVAEAEAQKVVKAQNERLQKAETSQKVPKASQSAKAAAHTANTAKAVNGSPNAPQKVSKPRSSDHEVSKETKFGKEIAMGQEAQAAALAERDAVIVSQHATANVNAVKTKLQKAEKKVADLQLQKMESKAVPLGLAALGKEAAAEKRLSAAMQAVSENAQSQEVAEAKLARKAQRLRSTATEIKNRAEQQLDLSKGKDLGESPQQSIVRAQVGRLASAANHEDKSKLTKELSAEHAGLKLIVAQTQKLSLDAAKIQENQLQAADASSIAQVTSHAAAHALLENAANIGVTDQKKVTSSMIKSQLKKDAVADQRALVGLSHVDGAASNAAAAESAGVKNTADELSVGNVLMTGIAKGLMPA